MTIVQNSIRQGQAMNQLPLVAKEKRAAALFAARDKKQVFSPQDQERAASNLHRVLEEVSRDRGMSKRDVAIAAGLGGDGETDSTKRFDIYTLPKKASQSRKGRLAKKPGKYFEIARAIAGLLNETAAPFICEIFEGCSFGADREFLTEWDEEKWARQSENTRQMSAGVARQTEAERYWSEVVEGNGLYDHHNDELVCAPQSIDSVGCLTGLAGYKAHPSDLPPVPSVLLGTKALSEASPATLCFGDGKEIEVFAEVFLEVRLALAPVGRSGLPGPMLEFRSSLSATSKAGGEAVIESAYFDVVDDVPHVRGSDVVDYDGAIAALEGFQLPKDLYRDGCGHSCWAWEEISPGLLREVFDDFAAPFLSCFGWSGLDTDQTQTSRFEAGTPAYFFNAHLISGTIERRLIEACNGRVALLRRFRDVEHQKILEAEAEASARWSKM